jgi:hypothetical protein
MDRNSNNPAETRNHPKANASLWFGVLFAAMIVLMIAAMAAIDIYGESLDINARQAPADAADR